MKVSREQVAENRSKILEAASRLFRKRGFDAVTVAEVMKAADLTHGGFYGHFKSKEELYAQTLEQLFTNAPTEQELARYVSKYLTKAHCQNVAGGCPTAALASETSRQTPEARAVMTAGLERVLETLQRTAPGKTAAQRRRAAIGNWSAMVGALILARVSDDAALSEELLAETRLFLADKRAER